MKRGTLNSAGHELLDPKPVAIPAGFKRPETLAEQVRRLVQTSVSQWAVDNGEESFEESEDFDIPDDPTDRATPYETFFDPILGKDLTVDEFQRNSEIYKRQYIDREAAAARERDKAELLQAAEVEAKKKRYRKPKDPTPPKETPSDDAQT